MERAHGTAKRRKGERRDRLSINVDRCCLAGTASMIYVLLEERRP
jgi:hypothetical protein